MVADAQLGVKGRSRQMQLVKHTSLSTQLMLSFESISPQSDKRQKLIVSKGGVTPLISALAQLALQGGYTSGLIDS